jgi:hypothetical protein
MFGPSCRVEEALTLRRGSPRPSSRRSALMRRELVSIRDGSAQNQRVELVLRIAYDDSEESLCCSPESVQLAHPDEDLFPTQCILGRQHGHAQKARHRGG